VETTAVDPAVSFQTTNSPQILIPTAEDRRVMRPVLIVLTSMIVISGLLLWIMHP
jgi:hypothetical protein